MRVGSWNAAFCLVSLLENTSRARQTAMASESFRACWIEKVGASLQMELKQVPFDELSAGDEYIRVKIEYSGVNYKDGMAICGIYGVVEKLPLITGIDFAGIVDETKAGFKKGDRVIMTGYEMGQKFHGGHAEYASVKAEWLVPLPEGLTPIDAMTIGRLAELAHFTLGRCTNFPQSCDNAEQDCKRLLLISTGNGSGGSEVQRVSQRHCASRPAHARSQCRQMTANTLAMP